MGNDMRYSDEKLSELDGYLRAHVAQYQERVKMDDERYTTVLKMQERNTEAIRQLIEETKGIVQLHRDLQGTVRIGNTVQKLLLWLAKWGTVGILLASAMQWGGEIIEKLVHTIEKMPK